jgi:SAM-dependent methyltransferase
VLDGGSWRVDCASCGSQTFVAGAGQRYERLYATGETFTARLGRARVELLAAAGLRAAPRPRLRTSDLVVLRLLPAHVSRNMVVLDWGCGSARVSQELDRRGWRVVPVDIVEPLVDHLCHAGFAARHAEDGVGLPSDDEVGGIVALELFEHLRSPAEMVASFRRRWPRASLMVSVPSLRRREVTTGQREAWDRPPEHHVRFSEEGLVRLLERCGYRARVVAPAPTGRDRVPGWWRRLAAWALPLQGRIAGWPPTARRAGALVMLWLHAPYVRIGYLLGRLVLAAQPRAGTAQSVVAVGEPIGEAA